MAQQRVVNRFVYDRWLLITVFMLISIGVLMVASASMVISDKLYHYPLYYLIRQLIYLIIAMGLCVIAASIKIELWEKISGIQLVATLALLVVVLIPGIGREVNGSARWIGLGPIGIQVSEIAKFSAILFMAGYLVRRQEEVRTQVSGFIKPMIVLAFMSALLLKEPDFGATVVILSTALCMTFMANVRLWQFIALFIVVAGVLALLAVTSPYRMQRLTTFLDPWSKQFNSGYQLTQSLIAFGRGGIFGVGLGNSIQKLFYLPEAHTDFLFAVLAEELGFIGCVAVVALFSVLVFRALWTGYQALKREWLFGGYFAIGLGLWMGMQAMINIGVNTGVLPTKGLTLPFMSYGGSSLLVNGVCIGVLLRIYNEVQRLDKPRKENNKWRA